MNAMMPLAQVAGTAAMRGAREYLRNHNLTADDTTLRTCVANWTKAKLPEALKDAKDALACGMAQVAEQTFLASMILAGTEGAKEAVKAAGETAGAR